MTSRPFLFVLLALFGMGQAAYAQLPSKPKEELKCDPNNKDEYKERRYTHDGKLHVEYCFDGKRHLNVDHGENG
ncbi:hypothetical protein [Microvirga solisilvae]|uniref:hypothetical protein n=1 Tax=Microvirga solisilvae TaxID=2919498 RepID=UPI001FAF39EF|nr:hypothetical protein [Microvirga solisilvae]